MLAYRMQRSANAVSGWSRNMIPMTGFQRLFLIATALGSMTLIGSAILFVWLGLWWIVVRL